MRNLFYLSRAAGRAAMLLLLIPFFQVCAADTPLRIMSANLNGNVQSYQPFALRIFEGLKPDIVAIQEFNYGNNTAADFRSMIDTAFGTDFSYFRENNGYSIPNGIISRYPIASAGSWADANVPDRGFAWAQVSLPGTNPLYVVSVHRTGAAAQPCETPRPPTSNRSSNPLFPTRG
jgi:Metal-dependent hydrolase